MSTRAFQLSLILILAFSSPQRLAAQNTSGRFVLIGGEYKHFTELVAPLGATTTVYYPADMDKDHQLYFKPFFIFRENKENRLDVRVEEPGIGDPQAKVVLTLLISPRRIVEEIAARIREAERDTPVLPRFRNIREEMLISVPLRNLRIAQVDDPTKLFVDKEFGFTRSSEVTLTARMPLEQAVKYAEELGSGRKAARFKVSYGLNALFTISESEVKASMAYLYKTTAVKDLVGSGGMFRWSKGKDGFAIGASLVTRKQRSDFEGRLESEIRVQYHIENHDDLRIIHNDFSSYFNRVFPRKRDLDPTGDFASQIAGLSAYDFPQSDLKPDEINKLIADVKDFLADKMNEHKRFATSGKFSYLGIGGSAAGEMDYTSLRDRMEDHGWSFALNDAHVMVPKSFEVHVIDETVLGREGIIKVGIGSYRPGDLILDEEVTTDHKYPVRTVEDPSRWLELLRIKGMLATAVIPRGAMLPYFGNDLPEGYVWADGQSPWPDENWVPSHLHGQRVPDMRQQLIGGAGQDDKVGLVWKAGKTPDLKTTDWVPPNPGFPDKDMYAVVSPFNGDKLHSRPSFVTLPNNWTYAWIPIPRLGGLPLDTAASNPRHVMCRWIIRVR